MEHFVRRKNIEHYRRLLAETTDAAERRLIAQLLEAEEARAVADPAGSGASGGLRKNP